MKERPILFSGPMVKAILEGRKTQTRRVVKGVDGCDKFLAFGIYSKALFTDNILNIVSGKPHDFLVKCPYGLPGDRLWVRESWQAQTQSGAWWHEVKREDRPLLNWAWTNPVEPAYDAIPPRWLPSIHMPREASRITLEIVQVRVERVQDISLEDVIAEGGPFGYSGLYDEDFFTLWDSINAARGYSSHLNPWVWVIEFERR
jgi:hypothetical protein